MTWPMMVVSEKKKFRTTLADLPDESTSTMPSSPKPVIIKKKSAKKSSSKLDPEIKKQRRETIEKRILKLESKLEKDRTLLLRYAEEKVEEEEVSVLQ